MIHSKSGISWMEKSADDLSFSAEGNQTLRIWIISISFSISSNMPVAAADRLTTNFVDFGKVWPTLFRHVMALISTELRIKENTLQGRHQKKKKKGKTRDLVNYLLATPFKEHQKICMKRWKRELKVKKQSKASLMHHLQLAHPSA